MAISVTAAQLKQMVRFRHGKAVGSKSAVINPLAQFWDKHVVPSGIANNPRRVSHFLSQIAHETDHFKTLREYHDGSNYEGREDIGNVRPGDGRRYPGRGYLQLTGRDGYRRIGSDIGVDLEGNPSLAQDPETAVRAAVAIWKWKDLVGPKADGDHPADVKTVTRAINGGYNGYDDRLAYYRAARRIWRDEAATVPTPDQEERVQALIAELNEKAAEIERLTGRNVRIDIEINT